MVSIITRHFLYFPAATLIRKSNCLRVKPTIWSAVSLGNDASIPRIPTNWKSILPEKTKSKNKVAVTEKPPSNYRSKEFCFRLEWMNEISYTLFGPQHSKSAALTTSQSYHSIVFVDSRSSRVHTRWSKTGTLCLTCDEHMPMWTAATLLRLCGDRVSLFASSAVCSVCVACCSHPNGQIWNVQNSVCVAETQK